MADSGTCGESVNVVLCRIGEYHTDGIYEGIRESVLLTAEEINGYIASGVITDGFTLSAWSIMSAMHLI